MTYREICVVEYISLSQSSLLKQLYTNYIKTDDDINASIIAECANIRNDTSNCDTMSQCDANDIAMYLTSMSLNCRPHQDCTFVVFLRAAPCYCTLMYSVLLLLLLTVNADFSMLYFPCNCSHERYDKCASKSVTNLHFKSIQ